MLLPLFLNDSHRCTALHTPHRHPDTPTCNTRIERCTSYNITESQILQSYAESITHVPGTLHGSKASNIHAISALFSLHIIVLLRRRCCSELCVVVIVVPDITANTSVVRMIDVRLIKWRAIYRRTRGSLAMKRKGTVGFNSSRTTVCVVAFGATLRSTGLR
jgi:hypothetical protein